MKSIRLNKAIREQIVGNISKAYELKNKKPVLDSSGSLKADLIAVIKKEYILEAKVVLDKATKAGIETYLETTTYKAAYLNGEYFEEIRFDDAVVDLNKKSRAYIDLGNTTNKVVLKAYNTYLRKRKKVKANYDICNAWKLAKDNYMTDVSNVVSGVNTTKQLLEVWPECEKFIPKGLVNPSSINLPSVSIKALNQKI